MAKLVYVRSLKGVAAEIWHTEGCERRGGFPVDTLKQIPLSEEEAALPLSDLMQMYPFVHSAQDVTHGG